MVYNNRMDNGQKFTGLEFAGRWIGESQGCDSPAHLWEIQLNGNLLTIYTCWEGDITGDPMTGSLVPGEPVFALGGDRAILVDPEHFIIPGWDTNDMRGGAGPAHDVVFSRPGIAELSSSAVYEKWRADPRAADSQPSARPHKRRMSRRQ